jgi:hypothetical protein
MSLPLVENWASHELASVTFDGQSYAQALKMNSGYLDFYLGKRHSRFQTLVGASDLAEADFKVTYEVLGDGKELYRSPTMQVGAEPQSLDLDVRGVLRLRLVARTRGTERPEGNRAFWVNPHLYRGEYTLPAKVAKIVLDGNPLDTQAPILHGEPCLPLSLVQRLQGSDPKISWDPERGEVVIVTQ